MKKVYSAPEILFESFTLSTNIAGDCEVKTNTPSNTNQCGLLSSGLWVFVSGMQGCTGIAVDNIDNNGSGDGDFNGLCYHVPTEDNNLFNS